MKRILFYIVLLSVLGCSRVPYDGFTATHPEYSPLVPSTHSSEYQITWMRSWKPTVYFRLRGIYSLYGNEYYLSYSLSGEHIKPLKKIRITSQQWNKFTSALDDTGFWAYDSDCDERAYQLQKFLSCPSDPKHEQIEEIILMDGASISIAASEGTRSKAIYVICSDYERCFPFGAFPLAISSEIGLEI